MSIHQAGRRVTTQVIRDMKASQEKIAMLTAYDYTMARLLDAAGTDILLVGDSVGNVFSGFETTLPVTVEQMIYHAQAVVRGTERALVIVDMPFLSYQVNPEEALKNAGKIMKESGAGAVKLEGGAEMVPAIRKITDAGVPVMGHLGLTPQSIHQFGTYKVRAREEQEAVRLVQDAKKLEEAGCFAIVLEKIPAQVAEKVTASVSVPTIGIGAGAGCDGQVLVSYDMLGLFNEFRPRFVRRYAELGDTVLDAVKTYVTDVRKKNFPSKEESY